MGDNSIDRFNGLNSSLAVKAPCVAVALANITLSGEQTVNGVAVVSDDRVLVTAQTVDKDNGIYDVSTAAWTRSADFDGNRDATSGTLVVIATPPSLGFYQLSGTNPIKIGTSDLTFTVVADLALAANLALTTTGEGASLVALEDAADNFVEATVEAALAELFSGINQLKVKTADELLIDTTLRNDTHLVGWNVLADIFYKVTGYLIVTADAAGRDFKMDFIFSEVAQQNQLLVYEVDNGTANTLDAVNQSSLSTTRTVDIDGTAEVGIHIVGIVRGHATLPLVIDLQVAQGTDAGTTTFKKGSWVKFEKILG